MQHIVTFGRRAVAFDAAKTITYTGNCCCVCYGGDNASYFYGRQALRVWTCANSLSDRYGYSLIETTEAIAA